MKNSTAPSLSFAASAQPSTASASAGVGSITVTTATLGRAWSATTRASAGHLWKFAGMVARFVAANPGVKLVDIGQACADAVGREKPYSKAWVSRFVNAANKYGDEPTTPEQCREFVDFLNGNGTRTAKAKSKTPATAADLIARGVSFLKSAIGEGATEDDIRTAIDEMLTSMGESDADQSEDADALAA